jgi:hypothetical protein
MTVALSRELNTVTDYAGICHESLLWRTPARPAERGGLETRPLFNDLFAPPARQIALHLKMIRRSSLQYVVRRNTSFRRELAPFRLDRGKVFVKTRAT